MTSQEILKLLVILIPVAFGFVLSQMSEAWKHHQASRKKEKSLRKLIDLETEKNIFQVKLYWNKIISIHNTRNSESGDFDYVQLANTIANMPFLNLSMDAWNVNIGEIASVYDENELERLWNLYNDFERLFSLYKFFLGAKNTERTDEQSLLRATNDPSPFAVFRDTYSFAENAKHPAMEFEKLTKDITVFNMEAEYPFPLV